MTPGKINASESASAMETPIGEQIFKDEPPPNVDLVELKKPVVAFASDISSAIDRNDAKSKQSNKVS